MRGAPAGALKEKGANAPGTAAATTTGGDYLDNPFASSIFPLAAMMMLTGPY
jgi:hypothetical protein